MRQYLHTTYTYNHVRIIYWLHTYHVRVDDQQCCETKTADLENRNHFLSDQWLILTPHWLRNILLDCMYFYERGREQ